MGTVIRHDPLLEKDWSSQMKMPHESSHLFLIFVPAHLFCNPCTHLCKEPLTTHLEDQPQTPLTWLILEDLVVGDMEKRRPSLYSRQLENLDFQELEEGPLAIWWELWCVQAEHDLNEWMNWDFDLCSSKLKKSDRWFGWTLNLCCLFFKRRSTRAKLFPSHPDSVILLSSNTLFKDH